MLESEFFEHARSFNLFNPAIIIRNYLLPCHVKNIKNISLVRSEASFGHDLLIDFENSEGDSFQKIFKLPGISMNPCHMEKVADEIVEYIDHIEGVKVVKSEKNGSHFEDFVI